MTFQKQQSEFLYDLLLKNHNEPEKRFENEAQDVKLICYSLLKFKQVFLFFSFQTDTPGGILYYYKYYHVYHVCPEK